MRAPGFPARSAFFGHILKVKLYIHTIHLYLTFPCFLHVLCAHLFWNQWCSSCHSRPVSCCAAGFSTFASTCTPVHLRLPHLHFQVPPVLSSVPPYYHLKGPLLGIQAFKEHKALLTLVTTQENISVYSEEIEQQPFYNLFCKNKLCDWSSLLTYISFKIRCPDGSLAHFSVILETRHSPPALKLSSFQSPVWSSHLPLHLRSRPHRPQFLIISTVYQYKPALSPQSFVRLPTQSLHISLSSCLVPWPQSVLALTCCLTAQCDWLRSMIDATRFVVNCDKCSRGSQREDYSHIRVTWGNVGWCLKHVKKKNPEQ